MQYIVGPGNSLAHNLGSGTAHAMEVFGSALVGSVSANVGGQQVASLAAGAAVGTRVALPGQIHRGLPLTIVIQNSADRVAVEGQLRT